VYPADFSVPKPSPQYARRVQPYALTALFAVLAAALAAVAVYAFAGGDSGRQILVGVAAAAVAGWLASLSAAAFRRRGR
jgi:hypothetical protein